MKKTPISLFVDDGAPGASVYYEHAKNRVSPEGEPLVKDIPNSFLYEFCDMVERYDICGKLSIVPMPRGKGNIVTGIQGVEESVLKEWISVVKMRLSGRFSFTPEVLTHKEVYDFQTGEFLDERENDWSQHQTKETLTPYLSYALSLLKEAGFKADGISSPWNFGKESEEEYMQAVALSMDEVFGKKDTWYALHAASEQSFLKPRVMYDENGYRVVRFKCSIGDYFWRGNPEEPFEIRARSIADQMITEDGRGGAIPEVLEKGGYPVLLTHWQSLYANGTKLGLRVLELVAERVQEHFSDRLEWKSAEDVAKRVLEENE